MRSVATCEETYTVHHLRLTCGHYIDAQDGEESESTVHQRVYGVRDRKECG